MCLMKDTKGNLFLDSKTIKEYRQRGVVSRKIILCYILAFLRWTSIGLPPGQKCSRWVRRHNGISLSPARLLKKYTGDAASIPFKKKRIAGLLIESCGQLGKISQPIHVQWIRRPDYNEKTLRYRKSIGLPPGQKCSRWVRRHNGISLSPARLLRKVYQPLGVASIPFKKKFFSFTRGQMTQEINNTKLVDNDKVYCINRLPPEGLLDHW
jgi:hypothetical protein